MVNIGLDDESGGYKMTKYLLDCGYEHIKVCAGRDNGVDHLRYVGAQKAMEDYSTEKQKLQFVALGMNEEKRMENYEWLMQRRQPKTALFFLSDIYALEAISCFVDKEIQIPQEIGIAGYDDISYSKISNPRLTTVRQDVNEKAKLAVVIIAGLLMVLTRCVRSVDAAYKMIGWESIVLIAAMMPMSTALSKTGISEWIATTLVEGLHAYGPIAAMAGVYVVTSVLSTFISNSATAILVAPIAWAAAEQLGVSPTPFMMTAAVAASACFATPICTPPNAMVMNAGHYNFMDYVKVGLPLQIVMGIVAILVIPLFFPF